MIKLLANLDFHTAHRSSESKEFKQGTWQQEHEIPASTTQILECREIIHAQVIAWSLSQVLGCPGAIAFLPPSQATAAGAASSSPPTQRAGTQKHDSIGSDATYGACSDGWGGTALLDCRRRPARTNVHNNNESSAPQYMESLYLGLEIQGGQAYAC